jgi:hypothetical protein
MGNMSMDNMNNMTSTSRKLVINKAHDYNETISDQTIPGYIPIMASDMIQVCEKYWRHDYPG